MSPEFAYFLKVNIAFALFYAFYRLFFYKDTFFKLRRSILLVFFLLALVYPLMNFQEWVKGQEPIAEVILLYSTILPDTVVGPEPAQTTDWQGLIQLFFSGIYWLVVGLLFARFFAQLGSILWLALKSKKAVIMDSKIHLLEKPAGPFSFFKLIFVHPNSHSEKELDEILTHEQTHVSQWHSIDVVISELICILCWINPFAWLLKREVRHNLEYLADNTVLQSGYDSKSYQYHLLGLAHHNHKEAANIYNSFNVLHLQNRIVMMNKKRTKAIGRTKYLIFIPLVAVLMLLSNIEAVARITKDLGVTIKEEAMPNAANDLIMDVGSQPIPATAIPEKSTLKDQNIIMQPEQSEKKAERTVFTVVEKMPQFPGGDAELMKFIGKSIKYPVLAQENGVQGRVICAFIVNSEGKVESPEVVRGVDPELDTEALRVIASMPEWAPGKQRGIPVDVKYTVPITFRLQGGSQEPDSKVFTVVETMPQFPGGDHELMKFISRGIKYPASAQEKGVQGRVIASFIVEKDGSLSNYQVIRGVDPDLDNEALRIIQQSPKWNPGRIDGKNVRVKYTIPITFRLQ